MGIYSFKPRFQKILKPIEDLLVANKVHPTIINLAGLIVSIIGALAFYFAQSQILLLLLIPLVAFIRTALNALDGLVARRLKVKHQQFGEVLNEMFDRLSDIAIFLSLAFAPYTDIRLGTIALVLILLNSYLSILSKAAGGSRQYGGLMGKADRMIFISIMSMVMLILRRFDLADGFLILLCIAMLITIVQRFHKTRKELIR